MIRKTLMLVYAIGAYFLATASLLYLMGFITDYAVPKGISDGQAGSTLVSILIDCALISGFGLHHSITARASFKRWWTTIIPKPIERATYLYMTTVVTALLVGFWQPIPITIWQMESAVAINLFNIAYICVWLTMMAATFHFGHFNFLGLSQAWQNFRNTPPTKSDMSARYLYALVRHPISLGWMVAPLFVPHLTLGHLVFSGANIAYILLATKFEEADLVKELGGAYQDYQKRVPAFIPFAKKPTE